MGRTYDLRRLKQVVDIIHVLAHYDLVSRLHRQQQELVGACPLPGHRGDRDNRRAFRVNPAKACGTVRPTAVAATSWSSWRSWRRATTPSRLGRWRVSKAV